MSAISKQRQHHQIKFGTDGWRALIAKEFTYDNLHLVIAALAHYFKDKYPTGTPVIIGYDARFLADDFANFAAEVLNSFAIPVKMVDSPAPTPVIAHAAKEEPTCGAIIFTASHNPPQYMGLKYFPEYAGPATVDITNKILEYIDELAIKDKETLTGSEKAYEIGHAKSNTKYFDPKPAYVRDIEKLIDFDLLRKQNKDQALKVAYDPLYGVGRGYVNYLLEKAGFDVVTLHDYRDPLFGGGMPEPKEEFLGELKDAIKQNKAVFGASNDGDADRFAFIDEKGDFYPANKAMSIILKYLYEHKNLKGPVARTVATTHLLGDIAEKFGEKTIETPVGFKWVGEVMRKEKAVLGGEESGGMSAQGHIPEKDGVMAVLLLAEVLAVRSKPISELWQEAQDFVGKEYFYDRLDLHMDGEVKDEFVRTFKEDTPSEIAGFKVTKVDTTEGAKIYLDNGSWFLARPSGTEAMCRVYFEGNNKTELDKLVADVSSMVDQIKAKFDL